MSREVLGTRGDAEPDTTGGPPAGPGGFRPGRRAPARIDPAPAPPAGRPAGRPVLRATDLGTHPVTDLDEDVDAHGTGDADDAGPAGGSRQPRADGSAPPAAARGPLAGLLAGHRALVAAAVVGALLGGVLAVGVSQRAALQRAQSTASVHAWAELGTGRASVDAIALTVRVLNTGDAPVTVTGAAMHGGLRRDGPVSMATSDEVTVPPRTMAAVPVEAQAECSGPPVAENGSSDGRLQLRLRTADGRDRLVEPPTGGISLTSADVQEAFCGQTGLRLGLSVAQTATTPSGGLSMSLLNDAREPVTLDLSAPEGTRIVGEPALPLVVEPSRRLSLSVALEVDSCTGDAQRVQAGDAVQLVIDGRARRGGLDPVILNAWVARQVALACP